MGPTEGKGDGNIVGLSVPQSWEGEGEKPKVGATLGSTAVGCSDGGIGDGGPGFPPTFRVGRFDGGVLGMPLGLPVGSSLAVSVG